MPFDTSDSEDFLARIIPDDEVREKIKNFDEETIMSLLGTTEYVVDCMNEDEQETQMTFRFKKMSGWKGIKIIEKLRRNIGFQLNNLEMRPGMEFMLLLNPIFSADITFIEELMGDMFETVSVTGNGMNNQRLKGKEAFSFAFTGPFVVYEVLIRSLVVNFFPFFSKTVLNWKNRLKNMSTS